MRTKKITVKGLVQGIGYRPFVAETAERCRIGGWVRNTDGIVTILASGTTEDLESFWHQLKINSPVGAKVEELLCEEINFQCFSSFQIIESEKRTEEEEKGIPLIPADLPTCDRCLGELHDPKNRRYRHPFISCTSCGPRYSIIESLPYDRETITMKKFPMCDACSREYVERGNVRRHAQTIACQDCGPVLQFVKITYDREAGKKREWEKAAFEDAVSCLQSGGIVAVKDIGGYHLACTPFSEKVVQQLRILKGREKKPFAVMFPDMESIKEYCEVSEAEEKLLLSAPRPIVLMKKRKDGRRLAENVCGSSPDIGVMLPCNPLQTMLLEALGPLIMTSANASGELLILENEKMMGWLTERASVCKELAVLGHDRPILSPLDDSIVKCVCGRTQVIRRARGFVPDPIRFGSKKNIFAAGGDLKACFCYTGKGKAYLSQYLGDLGEEGCHQAYLREKERMKALFGFEPEYAVCDMHPGYLSAGELTEKKDQKWLYRIQHHEAHVASVIAEHGLEGPVLGFAFDGTGYGRDHSIWGSETFLWEGTSMMKRVAHLKPISLIGGDEGAKNADTILYGYMASFGEKSRKRWKEMQHRLPYVNQQRSQMVEKAIQHNINTVSSSSMGRLFDAVSAMLDICHYNGYEGEAAIELENLAATTETAYELFIEVKTQRGAVPGPADGLFDKSISGKRNVSEERVLAERQPQAYNYEIEIYGDAEKLFAGILDALEQGIPRAEIARGFIHAVANYITEVCVQVNDNANADTGVISGEHCAFRQIVLSGGTFQNRILLEQTIKCLEEKGYRVYINEQVPAGDGGICLGQAYLCDKMIEKEN